MGSNVLRHIDSNLVLENSSLSIAQTSLVDWNENLVALVSGDVKVLHQSVGFGASKQSLQHVLEEELKKYKPQDGELIAWRDLVDNKPDEMDQVAKKHSSARVEVLEELKNGIVNKCSAFGIKLDIVRMRMNGRNAGGISVNVWHGCSHLERKGR